MRATTALRLALASATLLCITAASAAAHGVHGDGALTDRLARKGLAPAMTPVLLAPAPWSAADHDNWPTATDTADLADQKALPTVHAVYVYPSDAPSRFATFAAMFQRDARRGSAMFEAAFGMGLRFDERLDRNGTLGPDGRVRRVIDFTVLRSRTTTKRMSDGGQWKVVNDELKTAGLTNANKKYLVWVDAPQSDYCGMSTLPAGTARAASHPANGRTVSSINRYYDPADANGGFCSPVVHEMLHSMGAVQAAAPHYSAGHCNDGTNDILCAKLATYDPSMGFYIDYGNDDYWDPAADPDAGSTAKLGWWTVNLNRFLCPPAAPGARVADCAKANQPAY